MFNYRWVSVTGVGIAIVMTPWHKNAKSTLLVLSKVIHRSPVDSLHKGPIIRGLDNFFGFSTKKLLDKPSSCGWFETLWRSYDITVTWLPNRVFLKLESLAQILELLSILYSSGAENGIFRETEINTFVVDALAADTLAPCVATPSAPMVWSFRINETLSFTRKNFTHPRDLNATIL